MITLKLNPVQKKFKKSLATKTLKQIFTYLQCVDTLVLDLLISCLRVNTDSANLFSPSKFEDDDKVILKYILNQS